MQATQARTRILVRLYLDGIGKYPLLSREDECRLARLIQEGREAKAQLARHGVHGSRKRQLLLAAREGDAASEQFINANLRLVVSLAKRYQASDLPLLDLVQEGNLGLIHAVNKFDWRKGFKFSTYATWWIKQAISRGIDNTGRTIRLPVHAGDQVRKLLRTKRQMESQMGRSPTFAELSAALDISERDVIELLQQGTDPVSLDSHVGPDGDSELGDMVADVSSPTPSTRFARPCSAARSTSCSRSSMNGNERYSASVTASTAGTPALWKRWAWSSTSPENESGRSNGQRSLSCVIHRPRTRARELLAS